MKEKVFDASKMRELRKANRLTQSQLAKLSGLSLSAIQGYEQGRYEPKFDAIDRISRALGSSFSELYDPGTMSFEDPLDFEITWIRSGGAPHRMTDLGRKAEIIVKFENLTPEGQRCALDMLEILSKVPEYQKSKN